MGFLGRRFPGAAPQTPDRPALVALSRRAGRYKPVPARIVLIKGITMKKLPEKAHIMVELCEIGLDFFLKNIQKLCRKVLTTK
jgi:hypothetical protein